MDYNLEELLAVAAELTDKYTSKESSSVPYEKAQMLMEAVIYCIDECMNKEAAAIVGEQQAGLKVLYQEGYQKVIEKVYQAKAVYERIIPDFDDYGCRNYRDVIIKGMPGFFEQYDARFQPQNHILTMDYPAMTTWGDLCGADLILEFLRRIEAEKQFLGLFDRQAVCELLERVQPEYEILYMDNICYPVMLLAVGCMIADQPVRDLKITAADCESIEFYFRGEDIPQMEYRIRHMIGLLTGSIFDPWQKEYFAMAAHDYAVRIHNALETGSVDCVFSVTDSGKSDLN